MTGYIYTLSTNGVVFYVGATRNKESRRKSHKAYSRGEDMLFEILEKVEVNGLSSLFLIENYWIEQFRQWGFEITNIRGYMGRDKLITPFSLY